MRRGRRRHTTTKSLGTHGSQYIAQLSERSRPKPKPLDVLKMNTCHCRTFITCLPNLQDSSSEKQPFQQSTSMACQNERFPMQLGILAEPLPQVWKAGPGKSFQAPDGPKVMGWRASLTGDLPRTQMAFHRPSACTTSSSDARCQLHLFNKSHLDWIP